MPTESDHHCEQQMMADSEITVWTVKATGLCAHTFDVLGDAIEDARYLLETEQEDRIYDTVITIKIQRMLRSAFDALPESTGY